MVVLVYVPCAPTWKKAWENINLLHLWLSLSLALYNMDESAGFESYSEKELNFLCFPIWCEKDSKLTRQTSNLSKSEKWFDSFEIHVFICLFKQLLHSTKLLKSRKALLTRFLLFTIQLLQFYSLFCWKLPLCVTFWWAFFPSPSPTTPHSDWDSPSSSSWSPS